MLLSYSCIFASTYMAPAFELFLYSKIKCPLGVLADLRRFRSTFELRCGCHGTEMEEDFPTSPASGIRRCREGRTSCRCHSTDATSSPASLHQTSHLKRQTDHPLMQKFVRQCIMMWSHNCLHTLLPPVRYTSRRNEGTRSSFCTPIAETKLFKNSFIVHCLYNYVYCFHIFLQMFFNISLNININM